MADDNKVVFRISREHAIRMLRDLADEDQTDDAAWATETNADLAAALGWHTTECWANSGTAEYEVLVEGGAE